MSIPHYTCTPNFGKGGFVERAVEVTMEHAAMDVGMAHTLYAVGEGIVAKSVVGAGDNAAVGWLNSILDGEKSESMLGVASGADVSVPT